MTKKVTISYDENICRESPEKPHPGIFKRTLIKINLKKSEIIGTRILMKIELHYIFSLNSRVAIWIWVFEHTSLQRGSFKEKKKSDSILCWCIWFPVFIINVVITSFLLLNSRDEFIRYKHESLCPRGIQRKLIPCDPGYHLLHRLPSVFFFVSLPK